MSPRTLTFCASLRLSPRTNSKTRLREPQRSVNKKVRSKPVQTPNRVACVVLAAGLSSRFGSLKQLAKTGLDERTLVQRALDVANESRADYVYVVLGHASEQILKSLALGRAQIVLNKDYHLGLSSSVRASISNLPNDCGAVVLMVADQPFLTPGLIDRLIEAFRLDKKRGIATLAFKGEPRNPTIFGRRFFESLHEIRGDRGGRDIVKAHGADVTLINVADKKVFLDVDTFSSLQKLRLQDEK